MVVNFGKNVEKWKRRRGEGGEVEETRGEGGEGEEEEGIRWRRGRGGGESLK